MSECPISNSIRKLRFNQGEMTQDELAKKAGVTRQTILAIESAKYSPSLELAFRISRVFGVSVEDVFSYDAKVESNEKGRSA
jgi:putative transcriptional regulator